ncbi:hypothetical protein ACFXK0_15140 [Nocardia sp. NPDC059177]|uniref:hypothetical protein n=1 Tax=Nocardia sp. NPDC059177 TaxID=3346759 RepID=UPI0036A95D75
MVSTATPLNGRQREVLDWIADGCPPRDWPNSTYKTTAIALQNRRLVRITKRGGWSAVLTETGEYYRAHGAFPAVTKQVRRRPATASSADGERQTARAVPSPRVLPEKPDTTVVSASVEAGDPAIERQDNEELAAARQLAADVEAASGELRRGATGRKRYLSRLVDLVNANQFAGARRRLMVANTDTDGEVIFTFITAPKWLSTWPRDVAAGDRIPRWHPVVASVRTEKRLNCTAQVKPRALRILHTFGTEADARGHRTVLPRREVDRHGYQRTYEHGDLKITIRDYCYSVSVIQQHDRVAHVPTLKEIEEQKRYSWNRIPKWDSVPNDELGISVGLLEGRDFQQFNDNSKRRIVVEDLLPEAMQWLEQDADRRDAAKEAARLRQIAEAERQREAARLAEIQHKENLKAEELRKQASQWAEVGAIRRYLVAMAARVQVIQDEEQRTAAIEWLEWCRAHVERLDPLTGVPGPPRNRYMTWEERMDLTNAARNSMP